MTDRPAARANDEERDVEAVLARLANPVRDYAWGSHQVIAALEGRPAPSPGPEAELWLSAHPLDPSTWLVDGAPRPLDVAIAEDPEAMVGPEVIRRFGPRLPFLLKVLAVEHPLSLQAHPDEAQACAGFHREEADGVPLTAPERSYPDPSPKPELLRALTTFDALCGFRAPEATADLLDRLAVPALDDVAELLRAHGRRILPEAVARFLTSPEGERPALVHSIGSACAEPHRLGGWSAEGRWLRTLAERYPTDPGVAVAALLELVRLEPGESLHVPAGTLHSYLGGSGVEIMASSDSVVRGGLTSKHVDVPELLHVLDAGTRGSPRVAATASGPELVHPTPAPHFRLSEVRPSAEPVGLDPRGGQIVLVVDGDVTVTADGAHLRLAAGQSAFVAAAAREVTVAGDGTLFRATVGDPAGTSAG